MWYVEKIKIIMIKMKTKTTADKNKLILILNVFLILDGGSVDLSGVTSRSGRVIKKSTKLMDFTSPDIETKKQKAKKMASVSSRKHNFASEHNNYEDEFSLNNEREFNQEPEELGYTEDFNESDSDEQQMVIKTEDDPEIEFNTPKRSIYITEKSTKKKMIKDGKIVMGKAQRKDKGKTRYTAYMLWAKEARQKISNSNPEMDFASVSKRLGEMWANVPTNIKYNWKRRAKRLANKMKKSNGVKGPPQPSKYMQQKYYLNKNTSNNGSCSNVNSNVTLTKQQKQLQKLLKNEKTKTQSIQNVQKLHKEKLSTVHLNSNSNSAKISVVTTTSSNSRSINNLQINRPLDLAPIDIAAHLKLLGESLINIGERLSQHEV